MAKDPSPVTVGTVHRWRVRLVMRSVGDDRLAPAVATYLRTELDYLSLDVVSTAGPPIAQLSVVAENPSVAFEYAAKRVQRALREVGFGLARCELVEVSPDLRHDW